MASLPTVIETESLLRERLAAVRDALRRDRLHFLLLIQSGAVSSLKQAADHLLRHRNTLATWAGLYRKGGLDLLLNVKPAGKPPGQHTIPEPAFEALKEHLATAEGFASYAQIQGWLAQHHGIEIPYSTLHQIVRYELRAKLKAPRPSHPKKVR